MARLLSKYHQKRDFDITGEPKGKTGKRKNAHLAFLIQKHGARRLHYDFRLELDGVMKSWAVTRGPSYDPADKRLAVHVEDHPMDYNKFEGVIPDKQYGAGPVMIWDTGEWVPEEDPRKALKKGRLTFQMSGKRMHGRWHLVRMHTKERRDNWLLIKGDDEYVLKGKKNEKFLDEENTSIISSRTLEEIKENKKEKLENKKDKLKKVKSRVSKTSLNFQKKYPTHELATLVEFPPNGKDWWHEIKYDGYRIMAFLEKGNVVLRTRGGKDWTHKFQDIADQLAKIKAKSAVLDGELCVLDEKGVTNFSALQEALSRENASHIEGWFFDLLHLDGKDYTKEPLSKRKAALEKMLAKEKLPLIHYSEHFESSPDLLEKACKVGAEGLVSKNKNSFYRFRRTHDWVKSKCGQEQEFVIGGFMPAKDNPKAVGSLLLGYNKGGKFLYAGKVGTGFGVELSKKIYKRLNPLRIKKSPFDSAVEKSRRPHFWVKPQVLCEVSFWEWTADQHIRHASFKGLREDKAPEMVVREIPERPTRKSKKSNFIIEGITITHPEREVFPGTGITKGDIATYYAKAMPFILPFVEGRLISLLRCTDNIAGQCFFQRNPMRGMGQDIRGKTLTHKGNKHNYLYIEDAKGLLELVQMGTIEFHAWQSRVEDVGKPDQIIFDLDPGENVPFDAIKLAAEDIRRRLKKLNLESFPRLSGGKGIHVTIPINPQYSWDEVKKFAQKFAQQMERDTPEAYVSKMTKSKRGGKIFIDYLRNDYSSTAIAPFSLRARESAPIAVPVSWKELDKINSAAAFNITNIGKKMDKASEKLIREFFDSKQDL